jgi:predicted phage tail protein
MELTISGAGPSGGGGSKFTTRPDTLRSNDTFEGLLGLCVGPIKGPVNGMKSIRVNETPIEDASGNQNFQDFQAIFADGDPLKFPQKVSLRLGAAGAPTNIGVQLHNVGGSSSVWVTRTVANMGAHSVDLRFDVSQLYRQDKKGIYGTTAHIEIQMKPVGTTTWINPFNSNGNTLPAWNPNGYDIDDGFGSTVKQLLTQGTYNALSSGAYGSYLTINGKTTSPFVKELRIKVPNTGTYTNVGWDIRCRLVETESLDADPNFEKRTISWESMTAVYDTTLGDHEDWRGLAWLQLYGKASDSFNGIPEMDGVYDTKIVSVPPSTVFNPNTRVYTGAIWDGSWAKAYTNDPAWVINDAITDSLSGIARLVPGAQLNKWDALDLSKYCSELVSDGAGGQQPRFSLNLAVSEAQRSDEFIRYLAGACAATAWDDGTGEWRCVVDKPQSPAALYTLENIEGEFNYSHTDIDTRFNDVTVVFLNEEFDYREDRVRLEDDTHIALFGRKPTKIVAIGCTHRQQAVRWAILKMRTNVNEFRNVSFTTNRQGKMLERFNWILIADGSLNQTLDDVKRTTGRIVENKGGSIVLRDTIRIELGVDYTIAVTAPNPAYNPSSSTAPTDPTWQQPTITFTRTVTNTALQRGDVREIFISTPLPAGVAESANIALSAVGLPSVPKVYRVIDADYNDDGERVTINAIEVDTGKYAASDIADYDYHMPGYDGSGGDVPSPVAPAAGVLHLNEVNDINAVTRVLVANWLRPVFGHIKGYRVTRRVNDGPWIPVTFTTALSYELNDPSGGHHEFRIYTVDNHDRISLPLYAEITLDGVPTLTPVIELYADDGTFDFIDGIAFDQNQVITVTATTRYTEEAVNWSVDPAVTLGTPNAFQRSLSIANFGDNSHVTLKAVGAVSGLQSTITLVRNAMTTPNDSIIPDSAWIGTVQGTINTGVSPTPDPGGEIYEPPAGMPWSRNGRFRVQRA